MENLFVIAFVVVVAGVVAYKKGLLDGFFGSSEKPSAPAPAPVAEPKKPVAKKAPAKRTSKSKTVAKK